MTIRERIAGFSRKKMLAAAFATAVVSGTAGFTLASLNHAEQHKHPQAPSQTPSAEGEGASKPLSLLSGGLIFLAGICLGGGAVAAHYQPRMKAMIDDESLGEKILQGTGTDGQPPRKKIRRPLPDYLRVVD